MSCYSWMFNGLQKYIIFFHNIDIFIRASNFVAQIYAICQVISKCLVAYYKKCVDEASKEIKDILVQYDWTLLVADPHYHKSKEFIMTFLCHTIL
uniref:Uncharacterized protein n=1 Tax=Sander lucioperca TaxID=283035 RepID=A0A8C9ZSB7_SANLU